MKHGHVKFRVHPAGPFLEMPRSRAAKLALEAYDNHRLPKDALLRQLMNFRLEGVTIEEFLQVRNARLGRDIFDYK